MNTIHWTIKQITPAPKGWRARFKDERMPRGAYEDDVAAWALVHEPIPKGEREFCGGHSTNVFVAAMVTGSHGTLMFAAEAENFVGILSPSDPSPPIPTGQSASAESSADDESLRDALEDIRDVLTGQAAWANDVDRLAAIRRVVALALNEPELAHDA